MNLVFLSGAFSGDGGVGRLTSDDYVSFSSFLEYVTEDVMNVGYAFYSFFSNLPTFFIWSISLSIVVTIIVLIIRYLRG